MRNGELLAPDDVCLDLRAADKPCLLGDLSRRIAPRTGLAAVGAGIAIPHARLAASHRPTGLFARLRPPLDVDAIDGRRIDLVVPLLLPERTQSEPLDALASVARGPRHPDVQADLRAA